MQVEIIDTEAGFSLLKGQWRALFDANTANSIFLSWEWMCSWWAAYGDNRPLKILKVIDNGHLIGIAPFYHSTIKKLSIKYRTLQLIGDGSFDSDYLNFLSIPGKEHFVAQAVLNFLFDQSIDFDILLLNEVPAESKTIVEIHSFLNLKQIYFDQQTAECPYIMIPQSWDDYLKTLKPRMRTKVRSLCRKLENKHQVQFEHCTDVDDLRRKLQSLYDLHHERWQLKDQQGVFGRTGKKKFYREISELFLEKGWLRFYSLKVDDRYVAHQFCFEYQGIMSLLQEGFDPDWLANGVGNVLRAYVIQDCIDRKVRTYDFLAGVTAHKLSWGTELNTNIRLALGPRSIKNSIYFQLSEHLRNMKKKLSILGRQGGD